jgi:2Fe-2S ferredoxin
MAFEASSGDNLLVALLKQGVAVPHACEMQCACSTCHVYLRKGKDSVNPVSAKEEVMLDRAWGVDLDSRLSCQVIIGEGDLTVEIPKYSAHT